MAKKVLSSKPAYQRLLDEIRSITAEFRGTTFILKVSEDPEDHSKTLIVSATESPLPAKELDRLLSQALLPLFSKTLRNGLTVIPSVEIDDAKKAKKRA
jgi:hypothetical protein